MGQAPLPKVGALARAVITDIRPQVDGGRRPAKAAVGQRLGVQAEAFTDGYDVLRCELRYRHADDTTWTVLPMEPAADDRWLAQWPIAQPGLYTFVIRAAVDTFATWRRDLRLRHRAGQDLTVELGDGAGLVERAATRTKGHAAKVLHAVAAALVAGRRGLESPVNFDEEGWRATNLADLIWSGRLDALMAAQADPAAATTSPPLTVVADRALARCSAWYELFPRSAAHGAQRHGTFDDVRERLVEVERMGFDVLYLPPIHPIGLTDRKGKDGIPTAEPDDPGSPWAIGAPEGGHRAIHPQLGTIEQFDALVADAASRQIEIAIDLAFQASPDHPWVREHPEWFRHRSDGSIRCAENPPKVYEDIYPLNFESEHWESLWTELLGVVQHWISHGITVFRVDNPHTKPFAFWEWLIRTVREEHPEVLFLAEAFTRPPVMRELAKLGFSQSYTYFTWRSSKWELETYMRELNDGELADYFRPNFWPNTPDILTAELQVGGPAAFVTRLILAATLSANYGVYGPAFELQEHVPRAAGSEEYRRSEKYEIRAWDLDRPDSLAGLLGQINAIRRAHPALQHQEGLRFHSVENDQIIAYSKRRAPGPDQRGLDDIVVMIVNLDHHNEQSGWVDLDLEALGLDPVHPYIVHDLLTDAHYRWQGSRNFVILSPTRPAHILAVEQFPTTDVPA